MPDRFSKETRSRIMSCIRSRNTGIERMVFSELRRRGIHFQRHYRHAHGTPDVALPSRKVAVFIDGCFWHGFRYSTWKHKLPSQFWRDKIERNRARDRRNFARLRRSGWLVLRVWEHQLKRNPAACMDKIAAILAGADRLRAKHARSAHIRAHAEKSKKAPSAVATAKGA